MTNASFLPPQATIPHASRTSSLDDGLPQNHNRIRPLSMAQLMMGQNEKQACRIGVPPPPAAPSVSRRTLTRTVSARNVSGRRGASLCDRVWRNHERRFPWARPDSAFGRVQYFHDLRVVRPLEIHRPAAMGGGSGKLGHCFGRILSGCSSQQDWARCLLCCGTEDDTGGYHSCCLFYIFHILFGRTDYSQSWHRLSSDLCRGFLHISGTFSLTLEGCIRA